MIHDQMALTVHGKKRNIHRNDFLAFAQNCGISEKAAENMIRSILKKGQSQELWDSKSHPRVIPRTRAPSAMLISSLRIKFSRRDDSPPLISSLQIKISHRDDSSSLISSLQIKILSQG